MLWLTPALGALLLTLFQDGASAAPTWPAPTDDLEDLMYINSGYRARGFATPVIPCSKGLAADRNSAAEWVRTAFHDMASASVSSGTGGVDASILFELASLEHAGAAFRNTLERYAPYFSSRTSLADLIAAGLYSATRSCGGPAVPVRGGRRDATTAGASGQVPDAANAIGIFRNQFSRMGFAGVNNTEMIQLVACGHTLGGVHAAEQPNIIDAGQYPNDYATFDTSVASFDSKIASEFVSGTTKDAMVVGKAYRADNRGRDSDRRIYSSDGNITIKAMQDPQTFNSMCKTVFQRLIETVPKDVVLTDPILPYDVKPYDVQLTVLDGGASLGFSGEIRVKTTSRAVNKVQLTYKDRTGASVSTSIDTTAKGTSSGFDDSFSFYGFSTTLSADTSISSFNVVVSSADGAQETFTNNDKGYAVNDNIIFQTPQSCADGSGKLTIVAASAVGLYKLYSADSASTANAATFGVFAGQASDNYKDISILPASCKPLSTATPTPTPTPTSTPTSTPASTPTSMPTSTPTPTPSAIPLDFQGCYTDPTSSRALAPAELKDDEMTVEKCAAFCNPYKFFGLEYGRECYCGNVQNAASVSASASDCNMPCSGDSTQTCGAGQRLSLYKTVGWSPPANPAVDGYDYLGCYSEATPNRALSDSSTQSDSMTVQMCAASCQGSVFFGLEFGRECHCGSAINKGSIPQPAGDCSLLCPGNTKTLCGASQRLNIY
ncbi:heme peroxidase, partial [Lizonia empirigonia]